MADSTTLPSGGPTREEIAKIEIGQTTVSPVVARRLVLFFLLCLVVVPAIETFVPAWLPGGQGASVWSRLAEMPARMSAAVQAEIARGNTSLWTRAVAANRAAMESLTGFENALEDESVLGRTLRPPAQLVLSGWLGAGNERVYVGRRDADGVQWLFYRPDLEYVTSRGFLDPDVLRRRLAAASEWEGLPVVDPRPAILAFHRQLAARGITLILVPTPVKPAIHPEKLVSRYPDQRGPVVNPSYAAFVEWLRAQGIQLFDPADALSVARRTGAQYLATDTHWRPEAMELAAGQLAAFISRQTPLADVPRPDHRIDEREISNHGDTVAMLDLPAGQRQFPAERVLLSRVVASDGSAWRPDRNADVLVLGDSFSNIYSLESMGWGDSAGFIEHLGYALARPLDRIVQNDAGAYATREMLQRSGPGRLDGKRIVIWQFAARELAAGDWKVIE